MTRNIFGKSFFLIAGFWEAGNNFWRRNGLNFWLCMFKFAVAQIFFRIKGTEMVKSKRVGYETQGCPLERKKGIQFGTLSQKRKFSIFSYLGDKACRSWKGECFVSSFCFMKTTFYNCPKGSLKVWALKKVLCQISLQIRTYSPQVSEKISFLFLLRSLYVQSRLDCPPKPSHENRISRPLWCCTYKKQTFSLLVLIPQPNPNPNPSFTHMKRGTHKAINLKEVVSSET